MIRRPPRSTHCISSAASDVYKRQERKRERESERETIVRSPTRGNGCRSGEDSFNVFFYPTPLHTRTHTRRCPEPALGLRRSPEPSTIQGTPLTYMLILGSAPAVYPLYTRGGPMDETAITGAPCHSGCGTMKRCTYTKHRQLCSLSPTMVI